MPVRGISEDGQPDIAVHLTVPRRFRAGSRRKRWSRRFRARSRSRRWAAGPQNGIRPPVFLAFLDETKFRAETKSPTSWVESPGKLKLRRCRCGESTLDPESVLSDPEDLDLRQNLRVRTEAEDPEPCEITTKPRQRERRRRKPLDPGSTTRSCDGTVSVDSVFSGRCCPKEGVDTSPRLQGQTTESRRIAPLHGREV